MKWKYHINSYLQIFIDDFWASLLFVIKPSILKGFRVTFKKFIFFQTSFFRQHNCDTTDTQLKYKSRAAQLYRDKLHNEAAKAMRIHGSKLFIDAPQNKEESDEESGQKEVEEDFFSKHEQASMSSLNQKSLPTNNTKFAVS